MRLLHSLAWLSCYFILFSAPAKAGVSVFDNPLDWQNDLGSGTYFITETFDDTESETDTSITMPDFDLLYSSDRGSANKVMSGVLLMNFKLNGVSYIDVMFERLINGFSANFSGATNGDQITVAVNGIELNLADTLGSDNTSLSGSGFFAVSDKSQSFNSIRFATALRTDFGEFTNLDNFTIAIAGAGGQAVAVNEPKSWPLFMLASVLLLCSLRLPNGSGLSVLRQLFK